jgi:hypothetical protein
MISSRKSVMCPAQFWVLSMFRMGIGCFNFFSSEFESLDGLVIDEVSIALLLTSAFSSAMPLNK